MDTATDDEHYYTLPFEGKVRDARQGGMGINKIARELGIGVSTVQRIVAAS